MRLGIGRLVIVDNDIVKYLNLNRILNAAANDAETGRSKVEVISAAIDRAGLGTIVQSYPTNLYNPDAVRAVAGCDIVFGCVDTSEGRFLANLLATFYVLPLIDLGVALDADDAGAITKSVATSIIFSLGRRTLSAAARSRWTMFGRRG